MRSSHELRNQSLFLRDQTGSLDRHGLGRGQRDGSLALVSFISSLLFDLRIDTPESEKIENVNTIVTARSCLTHDMNIA